MSLILVEGPDGSGKSTVIKNLIEKNEAFELSSPSRKSDRIYKDYQKLISMSEVVLQPILIDRSILTEIVYRHIDKSESSKFNLIELLQEFEKRNVKIIYCTNSKCFERSMSRGEDNIVDIETSNKIRESYDFIIEIIEKFTNIKVIRYDYEKDKLPNIKQLMED